MKKTIAKVSPDIFIHDDISPEDGAMLQALYSRDPRSVVTHLEKVKAAGSGKFMGQFYVGYGHKSIGDCGSTTIFIEQVSMLAAKAIQDWPLYSGQEASTRYLDMSNQAVLNPLGNDQGEEIQNAWMIFYQKILDKLIHCLPERFPKKDGDSDDKYLKAIKAKAFDIARGFLPAGITTLVSWHTNLRQAHDHLKEMRHHPLPEISDLAEVLIQRLIEKYPNSFSHKHYEDDESYLRSSVPEFAYHDFECPYFHSGSGLSEKIMERYREILESRPPKSELPKQLRICGNMAFEFLIDFGSFRDFQRQRSVVQTMPLLTTGHGFGEWYLDQLPDELRTEALAFLFTQGERIALLDARPEIKQYYIGMGYKVACEVLAPLPAAVYIAELRSSQTVHPTLRKIAQAMGKAIEEAVPGIAIHCDWSEDEWGTKRGEQDIVAKKA